MDNAHQQLLETAKNYVTESMLTDEDKQLLLGRIPFIATPVLQMFVSVCNEDPFGASRMVENLKKKLEAQGNLRRLNEIMKREREEVEELINQPA